MKKVFIPVRDEDVLFAVPPSLQFPFQPLRNAITSFIIGNCHSSHCNVSERQGLAALWSSFPKLPSWRFFQPLESLSIHLAKRTLSIIVLTPSDL